MKIYVAAIIAFSPIQDVDDPREHSLSMTMPALIPAENIDAAAEQCKQHAFARWKPAEGWYGHHADVMPVTKEFFDKALAAYMAGVIDLTPEGFDEGRSYTFDN
jgi:hypothetical protein